MSPPSGCSFNNPIPNPPTTTTSTCAVPIGGSNSTFLDTCCNSHVNPVSTYGAPGDEECYMFCTTDNWTDVSKCLERKFAEDGSASSSPKFSCFNAVDGMENAGIRIQGRWAWMAVGVMVWGCVMGMV